MIRADFETSEIEIRSTTTDLMSEFATITDKCMDLLGEKTIRAVFEMVCRDRRFDVKGSEMWKRKAEDYANEFIEGAGDNEVPPVQSTKRRKCS